MEPHKLWDSQLFSHGTRRRLHNEICRVVQAYEVNFKHWKFMTASKAFLISAQYARDNFFNACIKSFQCWNWCQISNGFWHCCFLTVAVFCILGHLGFQRFISFEWLLLNCSWVLKRKQRFNIQCLFLPVEMTWLTHKSKNV